MFIENSNHIGSIEVITGSMFSGKTEELIRRLKRAKIANLITETFIPIIDKRFYANKIESHNATIFSSTPVANSSDIIERSKMAQVVGIDEAQFFDMELVHVCNELAYKGIRVIVAGLDMDYLGNPFGPIPSLLACAEYITKVHAICLHCGNPAQYSHRISDDNNLVVIGAEKTYEPLCRKCFQTISQLKK